MYDFFFKAVVQSIFLFYAEMWVVTPQIGWVVGGFQDQVTRRLTSGSRGGRDMEVSLQHDGNGKCGGVV